MKMKKIVLSLAILSTVSTSISAKNQDHDQQANAKQICKQHTGHGYAEGKEAKEMKRVSPSQVDRSRKADNLKKSRSEATKTAA